MKNVKHNNYELRIISKVIFNFIFDYYIIVFNSPFYMLHFSFYIAVLVDANGAEDVDDHQGKRGECEPLVDFKRHAPNAGIHGRQHQHESCNTEPNK